jgi:dolichol-phosphate mannosyltransferase
LLHYQPEWYSLYVTRGITDPLSGFFALDRNIIEVNNLKPTGYKILLEVLATGHYRKVVEVPYNFSEREKGETKYGVKEMMKYGQHLLGLAWRTGEITRIFKFMLVGASGIAVNEGLLYLLTDYGGLYYLVSSVIAVQCAILNNFLWNHIWTFRDRRAIKHSLWYRLGKFELVSIGGKLTNIAILYLVVNFFGIQYLIANLLGIAAGFIVNFIANNLWTWQK